MTQAKDAVEILLADDTPADAELTMNALKKCSMVHNRWQNRVSNDYGRTGRL